MHFNASVTFLLLVLENLIKYHKGDFAGQFHMSLEYTFFATKGLRNGKKLDCSA